MLDALIRVYALARKEFLAILKDPRSRFGLLVVPLIQCLLYGYAASFDLDHIPYAVLDQDRSNASRALLAHLEGSRSFNRVGDLRRVADIERYIDDQRALIVIHIAPDFSRRIDSGGSATIQVIADGRNSNTAAIALGYVSAIVDAFNIDWAKRRSLVDAPIQISPRAWYNPNLETRWYMIPSLIGTLTLLQTLMLTAMSVAREREEGTLDQLLVTPIRPTEIMAGKALPSILVGAVQASVIFALARFWFEIPFSGSLVMLYAGLALFLLAAVGIGLVVSSATATLQQAMLSSFVLAMPFALLSGLTTPVANMPPVLQYINAINPLRYAIEITRRVYLEGVGIDHLIPDLWPLALIASAALVGAISMFRKSL
ncbi:ABC transporter permease [Rhodopseudomonas palustris]|uniref:Transport permease protein n=1 Tax=Rhodopseudomonas palustris (strain BisB18) TaxID=316056 RepID=Q212V1_RHOPB